MEIATLLVALALSVLTVTAIARRLDIPAPLVLIVAGAGASYLPGMPAIELAPEVVLLGLLPPLLYSAALTTSLVEFNANRRAILLLSVGLVLFTTAGVAVVVHAVLPDLGWAAAIAMGAVVAPPDAVAATAIARRIGLPRRVVTILEGESLLNDATALVSLRTAIAAIGVAGVGVSAGGVALDFVVAAGGGVAIGVGFFALVGFVRQRLTDPLMDTAISLVVPFTAYLAAEEVQASGVIAVVIAGLLLGHRAPVLQTAQSRIAERMNWRTIAFVLENVVFLLIGLQAQSLVEDVGASGLSGGRIAAVCAATLVAVIVLRMVWVFLARYLLTTPGEEGRRRLPSWRSTVLLGWAGMRGVVTLAAAFIIPRDVAGREVLVLIAFTVVAGTLLLQGLSLPWLARRLDVPPPDPREDALARAGLLQQASRAGFEELERLEYDDHHGALDAIHRRVEQRNFAAWEQLSTAADVETPSELYSRVRLAMIDAERTKVLEVRSAGVVPSQVVAEVLSMLDVEESMLDRVQDTREEIHRSTAAITPGDQCPDLAERPAVATAAEPVCQRCLDEGTAWVALRQCLDCGAVACCDSSPGRHAEAHFLDTEHPVIESAEETEDWRWCYLHHVVG